MIQVCLIRDSVSSLQDESSTEDWTQIVGRFLTVVCSLYQELMRNNYIGFVLRYNKYFIFYLYNLVPRACFWKSLISYVQNKTLENQIIIKSFGIRKPKGLISITKIVYGYWCPIGQKNEKTSSQWYVIQENVRWYEQITYNNI